MVVVTAVDKNSLYVRILGCGRKCNDTWGNMLNRACLHEMCMGRISTIATTLPFNSSPMGGVSTITLSPYSLSVSRVSTITLPPDNSPVGRVSTVFLPPYNLTVDRLSTINFYLLTIRLWAG